MTFEQQLKWLADLYRDQGYQVIPRPGPLDLPPFAKDFKVELLGKRGPGGVLVAVKKDRLELAADTNLPRYAEVTSAQPDWRFDLATLQAENPLARDLQGAEESSEEQITQILASAEQLVGSGFVQPALLTACAGLEAAMRRRLRAEGEKVRYESTPQGMVSQLTSSGFTSFEDYDRLELAYRQRTQVAHGYAAPEVEPELVRFLLDTARELLAEWQPAKQPA